MTLRIDKPNQVKKQSRRSLERWLQPVSHIGAVDYRQAAADRPVLVGPVGGQLGLAPEQVHPGCGMV